MEGGTTTGPEDRSDPRGESLRILAVGNMYPPHHAGGYELAWQAAMRHARALGHQVRILASDHREAHGESASAAERDPDVHRTLRWYWDLDRYEFPRLRPDQRLARERHNHAELARHLRTFAPHHVSWWSMGCMSLSLIERVRRLGVPASFVVHDDWLVYGPQHDQWIRMWRGGRRLLAPALERILAIPTAFDRHLPGPAIFNSRYTLERARRAGVSAPAMSVVHAGIDERFLAPAPPRAWAWRLACVGRIDRQKGLDTVVRALAHLPAQAQLSIWGTGDDGYVAEMREIAARIGAEQRVHFHGWAGPDQLPAIYAQADAVVFPVRWEEPFGLVPLEAMGVGTPVLSTARGGTAEFVRDGENALVFAAGEEQALAARLRTLAEDEALRARLREGGLCTARQYTMTRFAQRTVEAMLAGDGATRAGHAATAGERRAAHAVA